MRIFCDFDGTISIKDSTDHILNKLAAPEWEAIESEWKRGKIGSRECMQRQIALISASEHNLNLALDEIKIDESFISFVNHFQAIGAEIVVISDGVDYFIKRILARYNLEYLPVIANRLSKENFNTYSLQSPYSGYFCESSSGVCKCKVVGSNNDFNVYVGDGRSDFCVADKTEIVFAKNSLAQYCEEIHLPYRLYETFTDVKDELLKLLPEYAGKRSTERLFY